ncbi:MAG: hypothetical protein OHK0052_03990 [Anaerolineales bacterium]
MNSLKTNLASILRISLILLVFLIGLSLRLRAADLLPTDYDEDDYLRAALEMSAAIQKDDWQALTQLNYRPEHPPLNKLAFAIPLSQMPAPAILPADVATDAGPARDLPQAHLHAARLVSVTFSALTVALTALLNPLAGLLLAVHTYTIKYGAQVMLEALPSFTSLLVISGYAQSKRNINAWLLLSAAALGLTAASKYLYCLAGFGVIADWLWHAHKTEGWNGIRTALPKLLLWGSLAILTFFAANPYLWADPINRLRESVFFHSGYAQSDTVSNAGFPLWQPFVWLTTSVPWHPGVFLVSLDLLITLFALAGLRGLWRKQPLMVWWLGVGILFLLIWRTKWPQYIVAITVPLSIAAAQGIADVVWQPLRTRWFTRRSQVTRQPPLPITAAERCERRAALWWLLPGLLTLLLISGYPLLFQGGMALTNFSATAIKDGLNGGVWREVWGGVTGSIEPVEFTGWQFGGGPRKVQFVGPALLLGTLTSFEGASLLAFEIIWTSLALLTQTALGVGLALLLHARGLRFGKFWLAIFVLPWAIPEFVGALMWGQLVMPRFGWFNLAESAFFQRPPTQASGSVLAIWQENPDAALWVALLAGLWYGFPLILLAARAGLKLIPGEVYEAASLDGASGWQQFRWITFPLLLPLLTPALIVRGIFAFNQFYLFQTLGTPFPVTTFAQASYFFFSGAGQYALSAALNLMTVLVLILGLVWFNRVSRAAEGVTYA